MKKLTTEQSIQILRDSASTVVDYDLAGNEITDASALLWSAYRPVVTRAIDAAYALGQDIALMNEAELRAVLGVLEDTFRNGKKSGWWDSREDIMVRLETAISAIGAALK